MPARVFQNDGYVYDTMECNKPNYYLFVLSIQWYYLSTDQRFLYLKYPYHEESHKPFYKRQFVPILDILSRVHAAGYVHSDIRKENLVFNMNMQDAWIINVDLADQVST